MVIYCRCFLLFDAFSSQRPKSERMPLSLSILSVCPKFVAATTQKLVNNVWAKMLVNTILNLDKLESRVFDWNAFLRVHAGK